MKNNFTKIILIIFLILLAFSIFGKLRMQALQSSNVYLRPVFGSICCERSDTRRIPLQTYCEKSFFGLITGCTIDYECKGFIDQSGCKIYLKVHTGGIVTGVSYKLVSADGRCKSAVNQKGECVHTEVYNFFHGMQTNSEKLLITMSPGDKINIKALINFSGISEFTPYVLKIRGLGGIYTFNSEGCFVKKTENVGISLSQIVKEANLENKSGLYLKPGQYTYIFKDVVPFSECVNYVESLIFAPIDAITTLNGKNVICSSGNIFSIGEITLLDGTKIKVADRIIDTYGPGKPRECCPGMGTNRLICGNDWRWHEKNTYQVQCNKDIDCYSGAQFIGGWSIDFSDPSLKTIIRVGCVNGICKFDKEKVIVECTHNGQCSGDKPICDVGNTWRCISSQTSIISGDGQRVKEKLNVFDYLFSILAALLSFLIPSKEAIKKKDYYKILISLIVSIFVGFIVYFILKNLIEILLAIAIFGIAGSIILYFVFGTGIFLSILLFLKNLIKS